MTVATVDDGTGREPLFGVEGQASHVLACFMVDFAETPCDKCTEVRTAERGRHRRHEAGDELHGVAPVAHVGGDVEGSLARAAVNDSHKAIVHCDAVLACLRAFLSLDFAFDDCHC